MTFGQVPEFASPNDKILPRYAPGILLSRLAAFAVILVGARILGSTAFGYFSLIVLIGEFSDAAMTNWCRISFTRLGSSSNGLSRAFVVRMAQLNFLCALFAMGLAVITIKVVAPEYEQPLIIAALSYIGGATFVRFGITIHQVAQNQTTASALEVARAILSFAACVTAMQVSGDAVAATISGATANLGVGIVAMAMGWRLSNPTVHNQVSISTILIFGGPLVVLALLSQAIGSLDKFLLKGFYSALELGYYSAAFAIARSGFDIAAGAFNIGTFVSLSVMFRDGRIAEAKAQIARQMAYILAIALPAAAVLCIARETIGHVLLPPAFQPTFVAVVPLIALGTILLNLKNFVFDNIFHIHMKNMLQVPGLIVGASVSFMVGICLVPIIHELGAAIMFVAGSFSALAVNLWFSTRLMCFAWPWRAMGTALGVALAAGLLSAMVHVLFGGYLLTIEFTAQSFLAIAGVLISLLICNAALGTRNQNLAISVILSDTGFVTGLSSYADSLIEALAQETRRGKLVVFTNCAPSVLTSRLNGNADVEWVQLPARLGPVPYKIYGLIFHQYACCVALVKGCGFYLSTTPIGSPLPVLEQTVTFHDLYDFDPNYRNRRDVLFAKVMWRWMALVSRSVICVSQSTRDEAASLMPKFARKYLIIREASKYLPKKFVENREQGRAFLVVCNVQPTKNIECLIKALRLAEHVGDSISVRWVGGDLLGIVERMHGLEPLPKTFIPLGRLSEAQLCDEYSNAVALVVPSWKEASAFLCWKLTLLEHR